MRMDTTDRCEVFTDDSRVHSHELTLHASSGYVTWNKTAIALTPKEFALLACLEAHAGTVLSSTTLLEKAWGIDSDPLTNIIAVYIGRLRQKLKQVGAPSLITNVRGFGYCFGSPVPIMED